MSGLDLDQILTECGALLRGHFLLTSGRHSDIYVEKFRLLERPDVLTQVCARIADGFRDLGVEVVAGPTTGGIIVAYEVARQLGSHAIYVESEGGEKKLRRGASFAPGARTLIVDDVLTTGVSVHEVLSLFRAGGAEVIGVGVLIDRSESDPGFGCPLVAAHRVEATSYAPDAVPAWLSAIPVTKPGTRQVMS